jgi:cellulose synthase/poly-beta-1,6-N-acetylglucosamine synthase-like glycosyltransferase
MISVSLIFAGMNFPKLLLHWQLILFIALCAVTFIQLFYFLFFFSRLSFYRAKPKTTSQTHPVSVVICARDESANIALNLPGSLLQDYDSTHEVIVVNDNSWDDSKYVLEALKKQYKQLEVVELTQEAKMIPGKKFPLSIGIKQAKYEIVLLTDADCVPASKNWIESMQSTYADQTEIVLGYGTFHKKSGMLNKLIRWETFHSALQYFSYALAGIPYMGVGRNLSYKKIIFFRHKGFSAHNNIPGGDDDLFINSAANRHNTKINIDKDSFTLSKPADTWKQWTTQKKRHYTTGKFYKPLHKCLLGLYALSHFLFYPLLILSCIFYNWQYALLVFSARLLIQAIVYGKTLQKLGEKDLFPLFLFFDVWMFFYYFIFAPSLVRKPKPTWK